MTRAPRGLPALQLVAAVGIVLWWVYWFASGGPSHGPRCAVAYEGSFPLADLALAVTLAVAATRLRRDPDAAGGVTLLAAGMALSLATLDTVHNLMTGGFSGPLAVTLRKALFAIVNLWVFGASLAWVRRADPPLQPAPARAAHALGGLAVVACAASLAWAIAGDGCGGALAISGLAVAAVGLALAGAAAAGAPLSVRLAAGALLHAALVAITHLLVRGAGV